MWISKRKWEEINIRVKKCEENIHDCEERTKRLIRLTAKKILEQPEELHEEISNIEDIEKMVNEFIHS